MSDCSGSCSSCGVDGCGDRNQESMIKSTNEFSNVKKVIAVISGKGGVGKSLITSMLAVLSQRKGYKTAILDADITGPSIPRLFGVKEKARGDEKCIYPVNTKTGISLMSINLLTQNETDPVLWRGPIIGGVVGQFWTDVIWGDIDYMFIDMPPGTGDVPLTVFQSIPVDGIIAVATPQELVGMIAEKAVNMASKMNIPIWAMVENMSYIICPDCQKQHSIFGESRVDKIALKHGISYTAKLPIDPKLTAACDSGMIELFDGEWLDSIMDMIEKRK